MNLTSGDPFWPLRNGLPAAYPRLTRDLTTEIVVLGAGITGALIADRLVGDGHEVVVLDGRDVAGGSTSASTALIQYEIDTPLVTLAAKYGEADAVAAYAAGVAAVAHLERLDRELGGGHFTARKSFYHASTPKDGAALRDEFALRARRGFPVELWEAADIAQHFDFEATVGILSGASGEVDPHRLAYALLARVARRNGVFDRTRVDRFEETAHGVEVITEAGPVVRCRQVVVACGYESLAYLPSVGASLHSTYALVSEPLAEFPGWFERCLVWETARPYYYFRTTDDDRLLAGGQDTPFHTALLRDALLPRRLRTIEAEVRRRFPRIPLAVDYGWTGTFAETFDGLPLIGAHAARPGALFALCFGGNGITYSVLAADLIAAALSGRVHPLAELFGFERAARG